MGGPQFGRTAKASALALHETSWADAGFKAAMSVSALIASCAALAYVAPNRSPERGPVQPLSPSAEDDAHLNRTHAVAFGETDISTTILASPSLEHLPRAVAPIPRARATQQEPPAKEPLGIDPHFAPLEHQALAGAKVSFDERGRLVLEASGAEAAWSGVEPARASTAPPQAPEPLRQMAEALVSDWQAPRGRENDIALFVASEDETLSWSLNASSPNHGALAYADDQVELGEIAIGVAMSLGDARLAAAYVEREYHAPLRGADGGEESFAGLTLTYRN